MPPRLSPLLFTVCASLAAAAGPPVLYIQGSEVNLRASPNTSADISAKVPIATECVEVTPKPPDKAWVKLKCGEAVGHTLRSLVSNQKPDFDSLLERATNSRLGPQARYDSGLRALALRLDSTEAAEAVRTAFFDLQFHELAQLPEYVRAWEAVGGSWDSHVEQQEETRDAHIIAGCDWNDLQIRKNGHFVFLARRLGRLHVILGRIEELPLGATGGPTSLSWPYTYKEFDLSKTLERALLRHGGACELPAKPSDGPFWSINPEDVNSIGSLPANWYEIQGEPGHRKRIASCKDGLKGERGGKTWLSLRIQHGDSNALELIGITKEANRWTTKWLGMKKFEMVFEWLPDEPGVARIYDGSAYPKDNGRLWIQAHLGRNLPFSCPKEKKPADTQHSEDAR